MRIMPKLPTHCDSLVSIVLDDSEEVRRIFPAKARPRGRENFFDYLQLLLAESVTTLPFGIQPWPAEASEELVLYI